jgi:hypothetical protein
VKCFRFTAVAGEKLQGIKLMKVCPQPCLACKAHALYYIVISGLPGFDLRVFPTYLVKERIFKKNIIKHKMFVFITLWSRERGDHEVW